MLNRWMWLAAVLASVAANEVGLRAATAVELHLYPLSGEVRLFNPDPTDFQFVLYQLTSDANAFEGVPAQWTSISDTYDVSGDGFVDPVNNWIELSAAPDEVSEAVFSGSGHLPALRSIGLGQIWNSEVVLPNDVEATIVDAALQTLQVPVVIALAGDYNLDLVVNAADYGQWRMALGSTTSPWADGNFDGIVDAADYTVWRDHFGSDISGAGYGNVGSGQSIGGAVGAVPEPTGIVLALLAGCGFLASRRSGRKQASV